MGKSTPKAPDPVKVSEAQTASNRDTASYNAALNRIDQSSPFGSVNYTQNGTDPTTGAPMYSQSTTLSPQLQGLFDSQVGSQQGISDAITGAIGRLPSQAFDPSGINVGDIRQRSYDSQMALLAPQFEKGARELEGTMNDRGIPIGAEIWNNQQGEYNRAKDTSMLGASRQADQDATNEYQRQYGNALGEYNMPYDALGKLMGNSSAVGSPTFSSVPQSQSATTDTAQNTWNAYNANVNAANTANSNLWGGLLGIGKLGLGAFTGGASSAASGLGFSDIRLKRDIKRIGAMPSGLPVYSYRYLWSDADQIGVMAQEAARMFPDAVSRHGSGYWMVHYDRIS